MQKIYQLSQNDSRWAPLTLGYGTGTIGNYGCTLTCVTMALGLSNVNEVNDRMREVNGFGGSTRNLIVWDKIKEAYPNSVDRVNVQFIYNNSQVLDVLKQNRPVLVQVNGTPIGGTEHWVLYIGNQKLIDPLDGNIKPTNAYSVMGQWVDIVLKNEVINCENCERLTKELETLKNKIKTQNEFVQNNLIINV